MNQSAKKINQDSVTWATDMALSRKESIIRKALNLVNDPEKKKRKEANLCLICFYQEGRIGGAAITNRPCGLCKEEQSYASTATDDLCLPCAKEARLCKQCGADLNLGPRRKFSTGSEPVGENK